MNENLTTTAQARSATYQMALAVAPKSFEDLLRFSEMASKTELVPKQYRDKPNDIFVAAQWGLNLGMHPIQAIQNICVINGRPSIYGDAMIGLVRASGKLQAIKETFDNESKTATCIVQRVGEEPVSQTFSYEDAKKAGLLNKAGPWSQYPQRMCKFRARGFALRDVFADVLSGLVSTEEAMDMKEVEITVLGDVVSQSPEQKPEPSATPEEKNKFYNFASDRGLKHFITTEERTLIAGNVSKDWLNELTKDLKTRQSEIAKMEKKEVEETTSDEDDDTDPL